MPRYAIAPRPSRRERAMEQTKLDQQQQAIDADQTNDYLKQAISLYGLSQDRVMQPERLREQTLRNDALEFENAWAQPMAEARHAATLGLAGQRNDKIGISPQEASMLVTAGVWSPDQAREALMSPEEKAALVQTRAAAEAARQQAIAADQAMQAQPLPTNTSSALGRSAILPVLDPAGVRHIPTAYKWLMQLLQTTANPPTNVSKTIPSTESSYPSYIN